jgi:hypothetical protein
MSFTYEQMIELGMKAQRINQLGQLQANLLQSLREPNYLFQVGGINFLGEDSVRIRMALIREIEALSQDGRKELEAAGVTFPPPAMPAVETPPPVPAAEETAQRLN